MYIGKCGFWVKFFSSYHWDDSLCFQETSFLPLLVSTSCKFTPLKETKSGGSCTQEDEKLPLCKGSWCGCCSPPLISKSLVSSQIISTVIKYLVQDGNGPQTCVNCPLLPFSHQTVLTFLSWGCSPDLSCLNWKLREEIKVQFSEFLTVLG